MTATRSVAIFPWGDVIEDYLDHIGLTPERFATEMSGGWLFGYVAALQVAGWRPVIICASRTHDQVTKLTHLATNSPIWLVPGKSFAAGGSKSRRAVRQWLSPAFAGYSFVLKKERCAAILVQEYEDPKFDRLVIMAKNRRIPIFASFQGGNFTLSPIENWVRPVTLRLCDGLIVASRAERTRLESHYGRCLPKVTDIPNPLESSDWLPIDKSTARRQLGIAEGAFLAVAHCRIDIVRKGLDLLVSAWKAAAAGQLVILGSGQDDEAFADLLQPVEPTRVRWVRGYTTDRKLIRLWLSAADLYISSSRVEGMPVAPLEAMATGTPVVATSAQGLEEIVGTGKQASGLLVGIDDEAGLVEAIQRMKNPALRGEFAANAVGRVQAMFSVEAVGVKLNRLLAGAAGR